MSQIRQDVRGVPENWGGYPFWGFHGIRFYLGYKRGTPEMPIAMLGQNSNTKPDNSQP